MSGTTSGSIPHHRPLFQAKSVVVTLMFLTIAASFFGYGQLFHHGAWSKAMAERFGDDTRAGGCPHDNPAQNVTF